YGGKRPTLLRGNCLECICVFVHSWFFTVSRVAQILYRRSLKRREGFGEDCRGHRRNALHFRGVVQQRS
ncbi:MAG: hypothetical protein PHO85_05440, partial [Candidatus Cloacimonetes bacterium]|nr:hypothetical protein [Candidatus Cloacimonadota bacterium]